VYGFFLLTSIAHGRTGRSIWDTGNPLSAPLAVPNVIDHVLFDTAAVLARVDHSGTQIAVVLEVQKYL